MERHDEASDNKNRLLAQRPRAFSGSDLRVGGRDRRGTPDAGPQGAATVGRLPVASPASLARASRRSHRSAVVHPDRPRQEAAAAKDFRRIYAPGTRQNRQGKPGLYRFYLAHTWSTTLLEDGHYRLEVEASDLRGNDGRLHLPFTITNEL